MLVGPVSPTLGVFVTSPNQNKLNHHRASIGRQGRHGARSAPPQTWHRRHQTLGTTKHQAGHAIPFQLPRPCTTASGRRMRMRPIPSTDEMKLSVDEVLWLADYAREETSMENRRCVMEEAQKAIRQETTIPDTSRPHSVIGFGLQAVTSPLPLTNKPRQINGKVDHIPVLLSLPSDRTFIPSPDHDNSRHMTTPVEDTIPVQDERAQSVAKQCCEIMGPSLCRTCRKLESRLLNREQAEKECPRMRITQENITVTQMVKRFYPMLTDADIQDKIARGEIARTGFLSNKYKCNLHNDSDSESDDSDSKDTEEQCSSSEENCVKKESHMKMKDNFKRTCQHASSFMFELSKLKAKLKNQTSTPLYFTDLKRVQSKILSGEVDRKKYLIKQPKESLRLKSAISSISTASSTKTTLSKVGVRLSESLMPVFVSPRKVKICDEPSYKVYYEPPLLSKRRQIPNPSFFAGSSEAYSLPERLPDIIEFADSKIKQLEKQGRSISSLSFASNVSEEQDLNSGRSGGDNRLNRSSGQKEIKTQMSIAEQSENNVKSCTEDNVTPKSMDTADSSNNETITNNNNHSQIDNSTQSESKHYESKYAENQDGVLSGIGIDDRDDEGKQNGDTLILSSVQEQKPQEFGNTRVSASATDEIDCNRIHSNMDGPFLNKDCGDRYIDTNHTISSSVKVKECVSSLHNDILKNDDNHNGDKAYLSQQATVETKSETLWNEGAINGVAAESDLHNGIGRNKVNTDSATNAVLLFNNDTSKMDNIIMKDTNDFYHVNNRNIENDVDHEGKPESILCVENTIDDEVVNFCDLGNSFDGMGVVNSVVNDNNGMSGKLDRTGMMDGEENREVDEDYNEKEYNKEKGNRVKNCNGNVENGQIEEWGDGEVEGRYQNEEHDDHAKHLICEQRGGSILPLDQLGANYIQGEVEGDGYFFEEEKSSRHYEEDGDNRRSVVSTSRSIYSDD